MKATRLIALALPLLLAACVEDAATPPPDDTAKPTVLDSQIQSIERAKQVEGDVLQQKEDMDKQMEAQGG